MPNRYDHSDRVYRFTRPLWPTGEDVEVDLTDLLSGFHDYLFHSDAGPVMDWVEAGDVIVGAFAPSLYLSLPEVGPNRSDLLKDIARKCSGGQAHKELCALAAMYLYWLYRGPVNVSGNSSCSYAGGWADVVASDRFVVVECGNLSSGSKLRIALQAGQSIMLVPYPSNASGEPWAYWFFPLSVPKANPFSRGIKLK